MRIASAAYHRLKKASDFEMSLRQTAYPNKYFIRIYPTEHTVEFVEIENVEFLFENFSYVSNSKTASKRNPAKKKEDLMNRLQEIMDKYQIKEKGFSDKKQHTPFYDIDDVIYLIKRSKIVFADRTDRHAEPKYTVGISEDAAADIMRELKTKGKYIETLNKDASDKNKGNIVDVYSLPYEFDYNKMYENNQVTKSMRDFGCLMQKNKIPLYVKFAIRYNLEKGVSLTDSKNGVGVFVVSFHYDERKMDKLGIRKEDF